MIIVKLSGKLGNQMFQYALALVLAKRNKTGILCYIDARYWKFYLNAFDLPYHIAGIREVERFTYSPIRKLNKVYRLLKNFMDLHLVLKEKNLNFDENILNVKSKNIYLDGHWQSEKYFRDNKNLIFEKFTIDKNIVFPENILQIANDICNCNSVCVCVRRGDYLSPENIKKYNVLKLDYYNKGIEIISAKIKNLKIFVFSDDIEWCKKNLTFDFPVVFMDYGTDLKVLCDFKLMTLCRHLVIANSTFSWWAAWLNKNSDKIVVAPEKWFAESTYQSMSKDIIPEDWIKI